MRQLRLNYGRATRIVSAWIVTFSILGNFFSPHIANAYSWEKVAELSDLELVQIFRESISEFNTSNHPDRSDLDIKIRHDNGIIKLFLSYGKNLSDRKMELLREKMKTYHSLTGIQYSFINEKMAGDPEPAVFIVLTRTSEEINTIATSMRKRKIDLNISKNKCLSYIVHRESGPIYRIYSILNQDLSYSDFDTCVSDTLFHSFYQGTPVKKLDAGNKYEIAELDFLNLRMMYDPEMPYRFDEIRGDIRKLVPIASRAKKWMKKCMLENICE